MPTGSFQIFKNDSRIDYLIGILTIVVYSGSLFFPLLDKDAAHHANIALHMYETGDYFSLVDRGQDYLDKPHLLFWTSLLFFKLFGVTTVAHRLPAVLFALASVYFTYKLTRHLSNRAAARIAAILLATAQAFVLSVNDARMETPLTTGICLGLWQWILYIDKQRLLHLLAGTLGLAIAFATKGWLGPVVVGVSVFFYILTQNKWQILAKPLTWLFLPVFFLLISPVLYGYYLQFDLHPEKIIRGRDHISGVKFILWDQLFERYKGFDKKRYSDPFYLYHTFMWAYLPWCVAGYIALIFWLRRMFAKRKWRHPVNFAALAFGFILVTLSFSSFKMPHYLIMLLPLVSIYTAVYFFHVLSFKGGRRLYRPVQSIITGLLILFAAALNFYFFKPVNIVLPILSVLMTAFLLFLWLRYDMHAGARLIYISAIGSLLFNFLLNYNFFPQLLKYQAGNEMAAYMQKENISIPAENIYSLEPNAHSFDFYTGHNHRIITGGELDSNYAQWSQKYFLMNKEHRRELEAKGYRVEPLISQPDYNVAKVSMKFLNPDTRASRMDTLMLARVYR